MDESARQLQTLLDLDARHDDLLDRLDDLDMRVAKVLSEYTAGRNPSPAHGPVSGGVRGADNTPSLES